MGRCFAGEKTAIEFVKGGVYIVEIEADMRRNPVVGVDLNEAEHIGADFTVV